MIIHFCVSRWSLAFAATTLLVATSGVGRGPRSASAATDASEPAPEHAVVLRVTREHFDQMTRDEFRETVPIERQVLSAWVSGTSVIKGRVWIEMTADEDEAVFTVVLEGKATTTSVSSVRSIRVHGGGEAAFHAEKRVHFDGVAYRGEPARVSLAGVPRVTCIESTRRGLLGRLAVRIARRQVAKMQPAAAQILEEDARQELRSEFDRLGEELIAKLNETTPLEETIQLMFPETKDWIYDLSTTEEHIQVSVGPRGYRFPQLPPRDQHAPVELWVRVAGGSVDPEASRVWNAAQHLVRSFLAGMAGDAASGKDTTIDRVGDWVVIESAQLP